MGGDRGGDATERQRDAGAIWFAQDRAPPWHRPSVCGWQTGPAIVLSQEIDSTTWAQIVITHSPDWE